MPVKVIPDVPKGQDPARTRFDQSVKEALQPFARMDAMGELPPTATLAEDHAETAAEADSAKALAPEPALPEAASAPGAEDVIDAPPATAAK
jgi:hypothetical protein